jgi:hypothetical protein
MAGPVTSSPYAVPAIGGTDYLNGSTSQAVKTGEGYLIGVFVASSSSGTIKLWDNTAGSGAILVNTFSALAGQWYPIPVRFKTGLFITVGGTIDYTLSFS